MWLNFTPQAGHGRARHRPALVLSQSSYNGRTVLMLRCPIIRREKGYPFEARLEASAGVRGVALCDQVKSPDWQARKAKRKGKAGAETVGRVLAMARALLA